MQKYLVDIYVPALSKHFDVYLPIGKKIGEVTMLLVSLINNLSGGDYNATAASVLMNSENGEVFNCDLTVYDTGIRNSAKLILI